MAPEYRPSGVSCEKRLRQMGTVAGKDIIFVIIGNICVDPSELTEGYCGQNTAAICQAQDIQY